MRLGGISREQGRERAGYRTNGQKEGETEIADRERVKTEITNTSKSKRNTRKKTASV